MLEIQEGTNTYTPLHLKYNDVTIKQTPTSFIIQSGNFTKEFFSFENVLEDILKISNTLYILYHYSLFESDKKLYLLEVNLDNSSVHKILIKNGPKITTTHYNDWDTNPSHSVSISGISHKLFDCTGKLMIFSYVSYCRRQALFKDAVVYDPVDKSLSKHELHNLCGNIHLSDIYNEDYLLCYDDADKYMLFKLDREALKLEQKEFRFNDNVKCMYLTKLVEL